MTDPKYVGMRKESKSPKKEAIFKIGASRRKYTKKQLFLLLFSVIRHFLFRKSANRTNETNPEEATVSLYSFSSLLYQDDHFIPLRFFS